MCRDPGTPSPRRRRRHRVGRVGIGLPRVPLEHSLSIYEISAANAGAGGSAEGRFDQPGVPRPRGEREAMPSGWFAMCHDLPFSPEHVERCALPSPTHDVLSLSSRLSAGTIRQILRKVGSCLTDISSTVIDTLPMSFHRRSALPILCFVAALAACNSGNTPATPTPPPAPTRIIRLGGNLNFGDVVLGVERTDGILVINNDGNSTLTFTSLTGPAGGAYAASQTSGTVGAHASLNLSIFFKPTEVRPYGGVLTVVGDQTAGTNTIAVAGAGIATAPPPPPSPAPSPTPPPSSGSSCSASSLPGGTTAVCNDGTYSQSQNRSGTCSSHGGVRCWVCPGRLCNGLQELPN